MPLKLYLRHLQIYDKDNKPIYYVGTNPSMLSTQSGIVSDSNWTDFTKDAEGLQALKLTWTMRDGQRISTGVSGEITLYDAAYNFVKYWLNDHVAAPLNGVEVRIEDVGCLSYTDFVIKADGLRLCSGKTCHIDVTAKQGEGIMECIKKTAIADNHLGWFHADTTKQHPRFGYCDEIAGWMLGVVFAAMGIIGLVIYIIMIIVYPICMATIGVFGNGEKCSDLKDINNIVEDMFKLASGCNRVHPSPLVRDYLYSACLKCGVNVNALSAPVFFDQASDYYNLAYMNAEMKKGVKDTDTKWWIPDNEPILTIDMFLDKIAVPFNAQWRIINNTLYFKRKDFIEDLPYLFDFVGADADQLLTPICYEWNGDKKAAYLRGVYQRDSIETVGNGGLERMNDIVEFNDPINPMLEGNKTINAEFGAQRYMWDGLGDNYLSIATHSAYITNAANIIGAKIGLIGKKAFLDYDGYLLMKGDTSELPKLIIWDGQSTRIARAVKKYAYPAPLPVPNSFYNTKPYGIIHEEEYDSWYDKHGGIYNYPMCFDAMFQGNLYDRFFQIEDPRRNPLLNKTWELSIYNCCDNLKRLGVEGNGSTVAIGQKVRLFAAGFYTDGLITEVEVCYNISESLGKYIKIKGKI